MQQQGKVVKRPNGYQLVSSAPSPPLFCSVARGEPTAESDIDLLVEFSRPIGLLQFVELKRILEEVFERSVDLVTPKALKPQLRDGILKEAILLSDQSKGLPLGTRQGCPRAA